MGKFVDITNERFGKLVAIEPHRYEDTKGATRIKWLCRCDCGNYREVTLGSLKKKHGPTISCGCSKKKQWRQNYCKQKTVRYILWNSSEVLQSKLKTI